MDSTPQTRPRARAPWSTVAVGLVAALVVLVAVLDGSFGVALVLIALLMGASALYTLACNRPSWARITGRKAAARILAGSLALLLVGGAAAGAAAGPGVAGGEPPGSPSGVSATSGRLAPDSSPVSASPAVPGPTSAGPPVPAPASSAVPPPKPSSAPAPGKVPATASDRSGGRTALAVLATLDTKGRAPKTGYERERFGNGWLDPDGNGCDARNDMLRTHLDDVAYVNSVPCKVASGVLADPYTGATIAFVRGQTTSSRVQIDHVVALADAWQKGAQHLTATERAAFANDPLNLQPTDGPTNSAKGAGDAATWLPPNKGYRCEYVARQIGVKAAYGLWVTAPERAAMERVLGGCRDQLVPTAASLRGAASARSAVKPPAAPRSTHRATVAPTPAPKPAPVPVPAAKPVPQEVYYQNCTAVRDAGADPVRRGDPGYASHLDRDGDGVGCE